MLNKNALLITLLMPSTLAAQQTREMGAHEHGHSALNIAVEGTQIAMALEAPGADIVGFEYAAKTATDRGKLDTAIATLSDPLALFVVPSAAGCTVVEARAHLLDEHHGQDGDVDHAHDDDEAHDEHAEDERAGEGHTEFLSLIHI